MHAKFRDIIVEQLPRIPDFVFGDGKERVKNSLLVRSTPPSMIDASMLYRCSTEPHVCDEMVNGWSVRSARAEHARSSSIYFL